MMDDKRDDFLTGTFPDGFAWGVATAAYQIEGAPAEDGKGPSIWDTFTHTEGKICDETTGDVACNSYHQYRDDIKAMQQLGVSHYRFSLSWPRLMPDGTRSSLNQAGVRFYSQLIDDLLAAGVQPMLTLYHWDLPQVLQDRGGWMNPDLADLFEDYARLCFEEFGDRVKLWITFNEPIIFTWYGLATGEDAPGYRDPATKPFKAAHTVIRAHAKAYRLYERQFKAAQNGKCGITLNNEFPAPKDASNPADIEAAEKLIQCKVGWFASPIFATGDYPLVFKTQVEKKCKELGLPESSLPEFTQEEIKQNKGSADFFGINHYTTRYCSHASEALDHHVESGFFDVKEEIDPAWKRGASTWLYEVPWGLRQLIKWVSDTYNHPVIYVTENGTSDSTGTLEDEHRIQYYRTYINEVFKAIRLDGCDVRGYVAWTLMDNFEWAAGWTERFGLHYVDPNDPLKKRVPKASAKFYKGVIKNNGFPEGQ